MFYLIQGQGEDRAGAGGRAPHGDPQRAPGGAELYYSMLCYAIVYYIIVYYIALHYIIISIVSYSIV